MSLAGSLSASPAGPGVSSKPAVGPFALRDGGPPAVTGAASFQTVIDPDRAFLENGGVLSGVGSSVGGFGERLFREFRGQAVYPFELAGRNPTRFLLGAAGIAALVLADPVTYPVLVPKERLEEIGIVGPASTLSDWGSGTSAAPLVIGIGAIGLVAGSRHEKETSVMLVEALLTSEAWTQLIKTAAGRERPSQAEDYVADWKGPMNILDNDRPDGAYFQSYPSGHTAGIWAVATVLAHQYPSHGVVPVLAYGTAAAMGYSRMVVGAHWLSDVVIGGLIGYGCARQVLSLHRADESRDAEKGLRLGLDLTPRYKGLSVSRGF
jgi:hypothetical protein